MEDKEKKNENQAQPVPRRVRGVMTIKSDDDMEFRAERKTGESSQEILKSSGKSKVYQTVGEKRNSIVAHLVVDKDDPDPASTMYEQLESLTKEMEPKKSPKVRGKILLNEESCRVEFSKKEKVISVQMRINISKTPNYNSSLMNLMYKVNQCFAINQTLLASAR